MASQKKRDSALHRFVCSRRKYQPLVFGSPFQLLDHLVELVDPLTDVSYVKEQGAHDRVEEQASSVKFDDAKMVSCL